MIEVEHLSKQFVVRRGRLRREWLVVEAVRDLSFTVERGELLGYLGPNGAGKSTTRVSRRSMGGASGCGSAAPPPT